MADGIFADAAGVLEGIYIVVVQAVAEVDAKAGLPGQRDGGQQPVEFGFAGGRGGGVGKGSGVQFDVGRANGHGCFDLARIGVDEKAGRDAGVDQGGDIAGQFGLAAGHAQAPFGGQFLALFRYEADHVGAAFEGDGAHFVGGGHFQVQAGLDCLAQDMDVAVADVPPVFAQMDDDGAGSAEFGQGGGSDRVGAFGQPGLADGGHMIDVDRKQGHGALL